MAGDDLERATLGGGCFWCVEAALAALDGVVDVTSGYAGGDAPDPTYEEVCSGTTGHAEVVQVTFDPDVLSYRELLEVFFAIHDPTTRDRQGPDVGSQYRSIVLYHDEDQRAVAESTVADLEAGGGYGDPIVTEIEPLEAFYEAEEYHQDYYDRVQAGEPGTNRTYCRLYVPPKLEKVRERFPGLAAEPADG